MTGDGPGYGFLFGFIMSLLEDPPVQPRVRRGWSHYLLPALVLVNVLLMLSLLGVVPPIFGDQPDPDRLARQIDAERVRVMPGGLAALEAEPDSPSQDHAEAPGAPAPAAAHHGILQGGAPAASVGFRRKERQ